MLIYSNIQTQQNTNNTQRTMKRERGSIQFCPHFFFSLPFVGHYAFVETKLSAYKTIYQYVMYHIQHFYTRQQVCGETAGHSKWVLGMPICHHVNKQACQRDGTKP